MPTGRDILQSLTIIAFASGIVAIGAQELYQRYGARRGVSLEERKWQMLEQLRGPDMKAQMSPERIERASRSREAAGAATSEPREQELRHGDDLSHKDRLELDRLLNTLTP